jgi:hypothetical protein
MKPMPELPKKKFGWDWIFWWRIDPAEPDIQVEQYETLRFWKAARKLSVACLAFSVCTVIAFIYFKLSDSIAYWDAGVFAVLAAFIYFGHRWAMIAAMILWTIDKGLFIAQGFDSGSAGSNPIMQIIWWAVFMHAFYLAFRVEQEKRKRNRENSALPAA